MAGLDDRLSRLTPEQRRLFEARARRRPAPAGAPAAAVAAAPGTDVHHLAPEQELYWWQHVTAAGRAINGEMAIRLTGELEPGLLERAMAEVVRRHPALRTSIAVDGGEARQRFLEDVHVPLPVVDVPGEALVADLVHELVAEQFDLAAGAVPWRQRLYRLGPADHVWALSMHTTLVDGASRQAVAQEALAVYADLRDGRSPSPGHVQADLLDVIGRHRSWALGDDGAPLLAAYARDLEGARPLPIDGDRARPPAKSFRGRRHGHALPADLVQAVAALGRREGVTVYMSLLAALSALFARYTGRTDVVVTTFLSTRGHPATEGLPPTEQQVGVFVNPMLLRCRWAGDVTFSELLRVARAATLDAQQRRHVPVVAVLRALGWPGGRLPPLVCQLMLGVFGPLPDVQPVPGLGAAMFPLPGRKSEGDLGAFAQGEVRTGFELQVEYDVDVFEEPTAERLWQHLRMVLARAADDPSLRLSALLAGVGALVGEG